MACCKAANTASLVSQLPGNWEIALLCTLLNSTSVAGLLPIKPVNYFCSSAIDSFVLFVCTGAYAVKNPGPFASIKTENEP